MIAPALSSPAAASASAYNPMGAPPGAGAVTAEEERAPPPVSLSTRVKWFLSYQDGKTEEMREQREARRYYHGDQYEPEQRRIIEERGQPVIENNFVAPMIDGTIGVIIRLRQDPKAYPRKRQYAAGAWIGTAAIREVLDASSWDDVQTEVARNLAVDGIGGVERFLEQDGRDGSVATGLREVLPETVFYDPRSIKPDFSDARFIGIYKWFDLDAAIEMLPGQEDALRSSVDKGLDFSSGLQDLEKLWYDTRLQRVKIVECWYRSGGDWHFAIHTGDRDLEWGISPFRDEKGRTACRYVLGSCNVDQKGTRYGLFRNMRSRQDAVNHRESKLLHALNTTQITATEDAFATPEQLEAFRREAMKPDGVKIIAAGAQDKVKVDRDSQQIQWHTELLAAAKQDMQKFGPSPALLGAGASSASGRSIALQQQAGIAQLGPYYSRFKDWKLRVYRGVWSDVRVFWTNPRMLRVVEEEDIQFLPINTMVPTPEGVRIANAIGDLDLDIVMDEGPDTVTLQEDVLQLVNTLIDKQMLPAPVAVPLSLDLMQVASNVRQRIVAGIQQAQQPNPAQAQEAMLGKQLQVAGAQAKIRETNARADNLQADAAHKVAQARNSSVLTGEHQIHAAQGLADLDHTRQRVRRASAEADGAQIDALAKLGQFMPTPPAAPQFGF